MTNSSPQTPPPSPEEQRLRQQIRQRVRNETMDEWIAIIVAFGTIGAILFWTLGLRRTNFLTSQLNQPAIDSREIVEEFLGTDREEIVVTEDNLEVTIQPELEERTPFPLNNDLSSDDENEFIIGTAPLIGTVRPAIEPEVGTVIPEVETEIEEVEPEVEAVIPEVEPEIEEVEPEAEAVIPEVEAEPEAITPEPEIEEAIAFSDVPEAHWAYPFLQKLGEQNLLSSTTDNRFEPDDLITRAGMANLISQAFDQPQTTPSRDFTDIEDGNIIAEDVDKAVTTGFMKGYSEDEFRPVENIPRYQVLVALATGLGLEPGGDPVVALENFGDRDEIPNWAISQVAAATEAGLVVNRPEYDLQSLRPTESATRAEVAAMIYQALQQLGKVENLDSPYIVPTP